MTASLAQALRTIGPTAAEASTLPGRAARVVYVSNAYGRMIEDPELSMRILRFFADDDIPYPSNLDFADLAVAFEDVGQPRLAYHVKCCMDAGLLDGDCHTVMTSHAEILVGWMHGLSVSGGNYVRYADSRLWKRALDRFRDSGVPVTTQALAAVLPQMVLEAL